MRSVSSSVPPPHNSCADSGGGESGCKRQGIPERGGDKNLAQRVQQGAAHTHTTLIGAEGFVSGGRQEAAAQRVTARRRCAPPGWGGGGGGP